MNSPADFRRYFVHRIGADYDIICTRPFQCLCGFRQNICGLTLFFLKDQCLRLRRNRIFLHQITNNP